MCHVKTLFLVENLCVGEYMFFLYWPWNHVFVKSRYLKPPPLKKIVSFHVWYFVSKSRVFPFWNFPYLGCVDRCYVFTRDIFFWNKRVIPFWNFPFLGCVNISCYLLQLFIHVQYVTNSNLFFTIFVLC